VVNSPLASPEIFTVDGTTGVITHSNTNQLVTAEAPAATGEIVSIYATGLGFFDNPLADGVPAPVDPPIEGPVPIATIDGRGAKVLRSIMAPGLVGVNRVDVQIPAEVPSGGVDVYLTAHGIRWWTSKAAKIWVQ
jgi:uncharacterized protein (TIGR03437 family)